MGNNNAIILRQLRGEVMRQDKYFSLFYRCDPDAIVEADYVDQTLSCWEYSTGQEWDVCIECGRKFDEDETMLINWDYARSRALCCECVGM